MKARFYLAMAAAALLMSNCSQDEPLVQSKGETNTLTATIEGASRSEVTDGGVFSWTTGDAISVYNGEGFTTFTLSSGNTFTATEAITPSGVAIYPAGDHSNDGTTVTVNLKDEYAYGSTNAPMLAEVGGNNLQFKHLGGLMRFVVKGVPSGEGTFKFTANSAITGDFTIDATGEEKVISIQSTDAVVAVTSNEVKINYTADQVDEEQMIFYVPLPTGTYSGYTVTVGDKSHTTETTVVNTISRGTLLLMPAFTYDENEDDLVKDDNGIVVLEGTEEVSLTVADEEELIVAVAEGAEATLELTVPDETTDGTVTISDGSEATESQTSTAQLNVAAENVSTLNINTPTLTVNLTSGTYDKVEALTAQQTLKIGSGVTIETLVLNGGNLEVEAGALIDEVEVKDEAALKTAIAAGCNVKLAGNITLTAVITIESETEASINLNNNKLITSTTNGTGEDITVKGKLNIINGTIEAAQTALYADGGELVLSNCTIAGNNPDAAAVAASGNTAKIEATGCTTTAANTAFYALNGAQMTLTNCTVSKSQATTPSLVVVNGEGSVLEINGGTYTGKEVTNAYDKYVIGVTKGATATINTTVSGGNGGVSVIGGSTANLTGGSYSGVKACGLYVAGESTVTYSNCTFSGKEGDVVVGGGTYGAGTVNGTTYTEYTHILKQVSTLEDLKSVIANGGHAIWVSNSDITLTEALTIESGKSVTIDLNNKKLITSTTNGTGEDITVKGKLNIINGTIEAAQTALYADGGGLVLSNCTIAGNNPEAAAVAASGNTAKIEATGCTTTAANTAFYALSGAQMTLTNCTVSKSQATTPSLVVVNGEGSVLEINGGTYTGQEVTTAYDKYVIGVTKGATATINTTVSGGNGGVTVIGGSTANLTGGSYSGVKACGLYVAGESTVTYSDDCTFSGVEGDVVVGGGTYGAGTVNGTKYTEYTKIEY